MVLSDADDGAPPPPQGGGANEAARSVYDDIITVDSDSDEEIQVLFRDNTWRSVTAGAGPAPRATTAPPPPAVPASGAAGGGADAEAGMDFPTSPDFPPPPSSEDELEVLKPQPQRQPQRKRGGRVKQRATRAASFSNAASRADLSGAACGPVSQEGRGKGKEKALPTGPLTRAAARNAQKRPTLCLDVLIHMMNMLVITKPKVPDFPTKHQETTIPTQRFLPSPVYRKLASTCKDFYLALSKAYAQSTNPRVSCRFDSMMPQDTMQGTEKETKKHIRESLQSASYSNKVRVYVKVGTRSDLQEFAGETEGFAVGTLLMWVCEILMQMHVTITGLFVERDNSGYAHPLTREQKNFVLSTIAYLRPALRYLRFEIHVTHPFMRYISNLPGKFHWLEVDSVIYDVDVETFIKRETLENLFAYLMTGWGNERHGWLQYHYQVRPKPKEEGKRPKKKK